MDKESGEREPLVPLRREGDQWQALKTASLIIGLLGQFALLVAGYVTLVNTVGALTESQKVTNIKLDALTVQVQSGAVPSATLSLQVQFLESRMNELRQIASDNVRRISSLESGRAARER